MKTIQEIMAETKQIKKIKSSYLRKMWRFCNGITY